MRIIKRIAAIILSIGLGAIFIYSGYSKLLPVVETFEFTFVDMGAANWYTAPVFARLLIGLEFFTGTLLIINYNLRKFTLPFTVALLFFFIIYLCIQIFTTGNTSNCGCFGEHIRMTPLQGILKNIMMMAAATLVYLLFEGWKARYDKLVLSLVIVLAAAVPFILNPVDYTYTSNNLDEKINYPLELDLLYHPEDTSKVEIPTVDLRKDKHVVAFLSLTCSHCRIAAKKFRLIKKNNPALPVYFILNGSRADYKNFIEDTRATNIPSSYCLGKTFLKLSSAHLPRIYYLNNGMIVKKTDYYELSQYAIERWIRTGTP
jgi:hypothetical protein